MSHNSNVRLKHFKTMLRGFLMKAFTSEVRPKNHCHFSSSIAFFNARTFFINRSYKCCYYYIIRLTNWFDVFILFKLWKDVFPRFFFWNWLTSTGRLLINEKWFMDWKKLLIGSVEPFHLSSCYGIDGRFNQRIMSLEDFLFRIVEVD